LVVSGVACAHAHAVEFPSVIDRGLGFRADAIGYAAVTGVAPSWCVEAGDVELFAIAGLRASGVRATGRTGSYPVGVSVAQLASPVGSEARAELQMGYAPSPRWTCAARVGVETVSIAGAAAQRATVAGVHARADAGPISSIADIDVVSRAQGRDTEVSLAVVARAGGAASVVASARFDGAGVAGAGVALVSRLTGALALLAGYDDGTESVRGAAVVSLAGWRVSTGVFYHGVLGISHAVTVAWTR
jgi:hypothetical protein